MDGLTEGRIVHYVVNALQHRPAIVVRAAGASEGNNFEVSLVVFLDAYTDVEAIGRGVVYYVGHVQYDPKCVYGTWHWIERA